MRLYRAGKDRTNTPPQPLDTSTPSFLGIRLFLASRSEQGIPLSMRGYDSIFLHRFGSWSQTIRSPLLDHIWNVYVGYTFMWDDVFFFLFFFLRYGERKTGLESEHAWECFEARNYRNYYRSLTSFLFIDLGSLEMCYYSLAWPVCASCRSRCTFHLE